MARSPIFLGRDPGLHLGWWKLESSETTASVAALGHDIMRNWPLFGSAIFIPVAACILNAILRYFNKLPQSVAGDLLLMLLVLDSSIIIYSANFVEESGNFFLKSGANPFSTPMHLIWVVLIVWIIYIHMFEPKFASWYCFKHHSPIKSADNPSIPGKFPAFTWVLCWAMACALASVHIILFLLGK